MEAVEGLIQIGSKDFSWVAEMHGKEYNITWREDIYLWDEYNIQKYLRYQIDTKGYFYLYIIRANKFQDRDKRLKIVDFATENDYDYEQWNKKYSNNVKSIKRYFEEYSDKRAKVVFVYSRCDEGLFVPELKKLKNLKYMGEEKATQMPILYTTANPQPTPSVEIPKPPIENKVQSQTQPVTTSNIGSKPDKLNKYTSLLKQNHNLILTGAPGTGKTHLAKEIASLLCFSCVKDEKDMTKDEKQKIGFVQFHPSYDYTDFVEGLRPKNDDGGNVGFERKDGVFKEFCKRAKKALQSEKKNFVFIIDEINRGEISKIFGELFFSIDPGYRGEKGKVQTQYQNLVEEGDDFFDGFYVPENVYIIGTMNDIDRSVESMDFAFRRRFIFKEVTATESAENMGITNPAMKRINEKIAETVGLGKDYQLGGAYFLGEMSDQDRWDLKISSLIKEYLRGIDFDGAKFEAIEKAYFGKDLGE